MDELGPEPRANFRLAHDEFTQNLEEVGRYERKLTHGFQLRFSSRIQILIHRLGEKNIEEADLTLGMRQPPKTLETLTQIRNGLSTLVSDLRPRE